MKPQKKRKPRTFVERAKGWRGGCQCMTCKGARRQFAEYLDQAAARKSK